MVEPLLEQGHSYIPTMGGERLWLLALRNSCKRFIPRNELGNIDILF